MLSTSTLRVAAASVAIVWASTASAQRADTATLGGPAPVLATEAGAPPESIAMRVFDDPPAATEPLVVPLPLAQSRPVAAAAQPVRLLNTAGWMPRLALVGLLALIGSLLLTTRWRVRNAAAT